MLGRKSQRELDVQVLERREQYKRERFGIIDREKRHIIGISYTCTCGNKVKHTIYSSQTTFTIEKRYCVYDGFMMYRELIWNREE